MISKCANPACSAHFLYLHEGRLFRVMRPVDEPSPLQMGVDPAERKPSKRMEFFWLCSKCSERMTIRYEKGSGIVVRPLAARALRAAS